MFLNNSKTLVIILAKPRIDVTLFKWYVHKTTEQFNISIVASFEICRAALGLIAVCL